jgi:hypothetical protein
MTGAEDEHAGHRLLQAVAKVNTTIATPEKEEEHVDRHGIFPLPYLLFFAGYCLVLLGDEPYHAFLRGAALHRAAQLHAQALQRSGPAGYDLRGGRIRCQILHTTEHASLLPRVPHEHRREESYTLTNYLRPCFLVYYRIRHA